MKEISNFSSIKHEPRWNTIADNCLIQQLKAKKAAFAIMQKCKEVFKQKNLTISTIFRGLNKTNGIQKHTSL